MIFNFCLSCVGNDQFTDNFDVYQKNFNVLRHDIEKYLQFNFYSRIRKAICVSPNFGLYRFSFISSHSLAVFNRQPFLPRKRD